MTTEFEEEAAPADVVKPPRFSRKQKIIAAVGAFVLLGAGAGAILMIFGGGERGNETNPAGEGGGEANLVEVPAMVINLRSNDGQTRFLKLRFLLVAGSVGDIEAIEAQLPLIIDRYQPFLRELRPEDLAGSAAVYRIKEELILRAADIVGPGVVTNVLIQDMIQQ